MDTTRRKFLLQSAAIICAPAIVKAENIMRIQVPPEKVLITGNINAYFEKDNLYNEYIRFTGIEIDNINIGFKIGEIVSGHINAVNTDSIGPKLR